jgi:hypothetical protein
MSCELRAARGCKVQTATVVILKVKGCQGLFVRKKQWPRQSSTNENVMSSRCER